MGTLARYGLVWIFLLCALTGYSQNMRVRSTTYTFGNTNFGHSTYSNLTASTAVAAPPAGQVVFLASNNTFYGLSSAGVLTDLGASAAGLTSIDTARVLWVATNGNDGTALRGRMDKPFLTLAAAKTAAVAGDMVVVRPGGYAENDLWKGGLTWLWSAGTTNSYTDPGSGSARGIYDDRADPGTTCRVLGNGYFKHIQANFSGNMKGAFVVTNAGSFLELEAQRIDVGEGVADSIAALSIENGRFLGRVGEIYDVSADASAGGARSSAIYFKSGYAQIDAPYIEAGAYAVYAKEAAGTPTASLFATGKHWKHRPTVLVQSIIWTEANAAGTPNTNFLVDIECNRIESVGGIYVAQIGAFRLTSDDHISASNVIHENDRAVDVRLRVKKAVGVTSLGNAGSLWAMPNFTGTVEAEVGEYRQAGTDSVFKLDGTGTVYLSGKYARAANGKGIEATGAGTWRFSEFIIDTTPSNNSANNPVSLGNSYSGLVLQNCHLLAPAAANSITSSVARTVAVAGVLQVNTALSTNVGISYGIVNVETNTFLTGPLTMPTAGNVAAPVTGSVTFVYTNGVVHALKSSGALVDLEAGGGVGDITGGNVNQFSEDAGVLTIKLNAPLTNPIVRISMTNEGWYYGVEGFTNQGVVHLGPIASPALIVNTSGPRIDSLAAHYFGGQIIATQSVTTLATLLSQGGASFLGVTATTNNSPAIFNGSLNLPPFTNTTLTVNQETNVYQVYTTNADFTVTFTGTALDGARGQYDVINTATTNIIVTFPLSYSVAQGTTITAITVYSNSVAEIFWRKRSGSNFVSVAAKEIVENFLNPTAGQFVSFHDPNTKTNVTVAPGGEINTISSLGTGWPLPTTKSGVDLRVNSITNDVSLSSSSNANTITFSRAALTGDVTASAGANATTIAANAVTDTKLRDSAAVSVIGRSANSSGDPADIAAAANNLYLKRTNDVVLFGAIPDTDLPATIARHSTITNIVEFAFGETNVLATGTGQFKWRAPRAITVVGLRASLSTASSSGIPTVDINESGATIISTKLTIDANETTSTTAAAAAVISDSAIADDAEITFDIDVAGTGAAGLKVKIYYTW